MSRRFRMTVAYDGTDFHGFAEHPDARTVMGELRTTIERVTRQTAHLVGAGRTDAGVHGWGQVVSGDLPDSMDEAALADLQRRVNRMLAPEIAVRDAEFTDDPDFNARFSASYRHYRYHIVNTPEPHPLLARTAWHVPQPLQLWAMQLACDPLIGEHDFSTFCRRPKVSEGKPQRSMTRRVLSAGWKEVPGDVPGLLRFEIRATAFCHQMVRSIVGTLVDVGHGKLHAGDMRAILLRGDRAAAGQVAPPQGLVLWEVGYSTGPTRSAGA
ncbi:MAG TPA: tRNA pseudouridine(38-40) synthase TruA [Acidimicrobiaceae bacterium]|nr:tRNA pseudouridine(38-40) synthase TruA [Acidimicrobiaceae bacterium]